MSFIKMNELKIGDFFELDGVNFQIKNIDEDQIDVLDLNEMTLISFFCGLTEELVSVLTNEQVDYYGLVERVEEYEEINALISSKV